MRHLLMTIGLALSLGGGVAEAGNIGLVRLGLGGHRDGMLGDHGWRNHEGAWWPARFGHPFGRFGLWGDHFGFPGDHGLGFWGDEWLESHFESKFDRLMTDYDAGLNDVEDFFNSEEYMDVVDGVERLIDRHDSFLMKVEWQIEGVGDLIDRANEHLMKIEDWLADHPADEMTTSDKHMWFDDWLMHAEEHVTMKIDWLTMKQMTLMDNLSMYESFQMELTDYLDEIVGAAMPSGAETSVAALLKSNPLATDAAPAITLSSVTASTAAVPEPPTWIPLAIAIALVSLRLRGSGYRWSRSKTSDRPDPISCQISRAKNSCLISE